MHQIGNTFTRLEPAIEFEEESFKFNPLMVCIIGEPPERFAAIHSQGLLNTWYRRLQRCVAEPVQLEQRRGHRRVQVLGTAIFVFDEAGVLAVYAWDFDENDRIQLTQLPARSVVIDGVPYQSIWMGRYTLGASRALLQRHPGQEALCKSYLRWAQRRLASTCWDKKIQARVRYQIAVALDLEVPALAVAAQIQLSTQPKQPLRLDVYNHAIRYREDFETLTREATQLMPLYALLADELEFYDPLGRQQITARMQNLLIRNEIKPAMWRLLCREGTHWMKEFLAYYDFDRQAPDVATFDLLRIVQAFGTGRLVPAWLLHAFIQLGGNPNAPTRDISHRLGDMFSFCARLGHLLAQCDEASLAVFKDRAQDICGWASDHWEEIPKDYVCRATLRGLIRKTDAQRRLDAIRLEGSEGFEVPYQLALKTPDVQVVILNSPLAIWTEGRDMRHCAESYIGACKRGECLMVSLRSPGRTRALATVAFDIRNRKVSQKKLSGFANTLVSAEVLQVAKQCQRQLQAQHNRIHRAREKLSISAASLKEEGDREPTEIQLQPREETQSH